MSEEDAAGGTADELAAVDLDDSAEQELTEEQEAAEVGHDDEFNDADQEFLAEVAHAAEDEPKVDASSANQKMLRLQSATAASFPGSYAENTEFEELALEYLSDFCQQFTQVYPDRLEPFVTCRNELGVRKPLCSFIKPSKLPFKELYDLKDCARFFSDFVMYEQLQDPLRLCDYASSAQTTINWQAGDCLDMAILLCSVLIGYGYDAYVVRGYAPQFVAAADQTQNAPDNLATTDALSKDSEQVKDDGKYSIRPRPQLHSLYILKQKKYAIVNARMVASDSSSSTAAASQAEKLEHCEDALKGQRVHCWVMVLPGSREVSQHYMVEPSIGLVWDAEKSPYEGIECVWNHKNVWINMQTPKQPMNATDFDLSNFKSWEYVFLESDPVSPQEQSEDKALDEHQRIVDVPKPFFPEVVLSVDKFIERFASGMRSRRYSKWLLEQFSWNNRRDGIVQRFTTYTDSTQLNISEIREDYNARKDRLFLRLHYPSEQRLVSRFNKGRLHPDALKEIIECVDRKEYLFHVSARLDGKFRRLELGNTKVIEEFEDRDDFLTYRSMTFADDGDGSANASAKSNPIGFKEMGRDIRKMTLKFSRNTAKSADVDCRRKVFYLHEKKIHIDFHFGEGRITASSRTYTMDGNVIDYSVNPHIPPPTHTESRDEFEALLDLQKKLIQEFKEEDRAVKEMLEVRRKEEEKLELIDSLREQLKKRLTEDAAKPRTKEIDPVAKSDYLSPYWPKVAKDRALTRSEAMAVKDAYLKALKDSLLDRAHIIESRLEDEQQNLARKQAGHQRQDKDKGAEDDYAKFVSNATFRIQILKQRRDRHEELAKQKFKEVILRKLSGLCVWLFFVPLMTTWCRPSSGSPPTPASRSCKMLCPRQGRSCVLLLCGI